MLKIQNSQRWETDFYPVPVLGNCALSMRLSNYSPVLDKNRAPMGPNTLSSIGARVWRKAPKAFPDSSSVPDEFQSVNRGGTSYAGYRQHLGSQSCCKVHVSIGVDSSAHCAWKCQWNPVKASAGKFLAKLRGPIAILSVRARDTCSDSIANIFRACFVGYRATIARYVAKWGIAQLCQCETECQRGVSHHFGGVLTSLKKYRAI